MSGAKQPTDAPNRERRADGTPNPNYVPGQGKPAVPAPPPRIAAEFGIRLAVTRDAVAELIHEFRTAKACGTPEMPCQRFARLVLDAIDGGCEEVRVRSRKESRGRKQ